MKYLRLKTKLIVCLLPFLCLVSCSENKSDSGKKVFKYNEFVTINSLDPAFATTLANHWAVEQLYNAPLEFNEKLEVQPSIARSWEVLDSGRMYRFDIRKDVFFHDHKLFKNGEGRKCTAYDMEYSLKRICDTTGIYNKGIWVFKDKVLKDKNGMISDTCFKAINDTTLHVYLEKAVPNFLQILCMPFCYVIPHEVADSYGRDFGRSPIGTGAFKFESWDEGNVLIFNKNEKYWKKDKNGVQLPYLDAVEISCISDVNQSFRAFELGYFDFIARMEDAILDEVLYPDGSVQESVKQKFNVLKSPYLATDYLGFNMNTSADIYEAEPNHPFLNKDVRKALNYAVDRKRIVTLLRNGLGVAGEKGFVPPAMPYFDAEEVNGYAFNQQKAIEHLKKSGFKPDEIKGEISIAKRYVKLAEFITRTWKDVLGVDIKINLVDARVCIDLAETGKINFYKLGWLADYPDGENYLTLFYSPNHSPNGPNRTHYTNTTFDSLYVKSSFINDPIARGDVYEVMDDLMMNDSPVIILYYDQILALTSKKTTGLRLDPMNSLVLETVDFKE